MSTATETTQDMGTNPEGHSVPVSKEAHLKWWLNEISHAPVEPPGMEIAMALLQCAKAEELNRPVPPEIRENFCLKVFEKRMVHLNVMASPWLAVFISLICHNPAEVVMWSFALKLYAIKRKTKVLNLDVIVEEYRTGLYTKDTLKTLWGKQKLATRIGPGGMCDNLLDLVRMNDHEA